MSCTGSFICLSEPFFILVLLSAGIAFGLYFCAFSRRLVAELFDFLLQLCDAGLSSLQIGKMLIALLCEPGEGERREPVPLHCELVRLEFVSGVAGDTSLGSVGRPVELPTMGILMALLAVIWFAAGVCVGERSRNARVTVLASKLFVGFGQAES